MYICRVVIRNFRNFTKLDLALGNHATAVVGENNSGKSNFLYAIRLVIDTSLSSQFRSLTEQDLHSSLDLRNPTQVLVSLEFTDYAGKVNEESLVAPWAISETRARITYRFRPSPAVREALEAGERTPGDLTIDDYLYEITGSGDTDPAEVLWNESLGSAVRFSDLQYFSVMFLHALRDVQQDLRQIRASPLGKIISSSGLSEEEKARLVAILQSANSQVAASESIKSAGEAIESAFEQVAGDAFAMKVRIGMADPSFSSISRSLTLLLSDGALEDFEPYRNGLGLNNVLYISMILHYFMGRIGAAKSAGQLLLIEEPEAHLHPQLQRVLCATLSNHPFQTIFTSHSTHITSFMPITACIVLTKSSQHSTRSSIPVNTSTLNSRETADLQRYLDATRSSLLFARKVILVEGPAELFLIPPLVKTILGKDLDRLGISVIPIYGTHFDVYTKLFSDEAIHKKCAIVADGDIEEEDCRVDPALDDMDLTNPDPSTFNGPFVKVFKCITTFEKEVTLPGTLLMLAEAAREVRAPRTAQKLQDTFSLVESQPMDLPTLQTVLTPVRKNVLALAKKVGKARFAQVASKHVALANEVPQYISNAIEWLETE